MTQTSDTPPDHAIPELFADGVLDVGFGNGMVRIDLFSLSAVRRDANGQPLPALRQRVVMSLPGFLSALQAMEGMRRQLEQAGVLPPPAARAATPAETPSTVQPPAPPRSPNFG
ncbi:hypothetical protein HL658_33860 [Azospirillum sp. RWY-5-1]|uniref:DUF3467 domain-containing protein n=1 Tax=Azospirillum oleiclasticum TaxID=2735135 RepID=A0ABX2TK51_9PROT|nr:hypothetical protein [Azospirillum oleiclasticum]NYZ17556.1 hypothetical protein [Azospirillum oleiclasticum]NYZ24658.1 hypothetical protein [Azospirillum oleiclasticum]